MTAQERKALRQATALVLSGDRSKAISMLRTLAAPARRAAVRAIPQMLLPFVTFHCRPLGTEGMPVHVCITRQAITDAQRTSQASRGQGTEYPSCDSRKCEQGRALREALDPDASWRGVGPGGRMLGERTKGISSQGVARARLARAGLLEDVRTIDDA